MKNLLCIVPVVVMGASSVHEFSMKAIDGKSVTLSQFKGRAMLVVRVASR